MSVRVAAIDVGTNSVLLLVAERRGDEVVALAERATITRLGEAVDRTRRLAPEAVARTLACLGSYAAEISALGAARVDVVGTSAMRDAAGGEDFRERAEALLGVRPRVISGDEEARLSFEGALVGLPSPPGPAVVFDVGGGSTELVLGQAGEVIASRSLDVGSVRLTERHVSHDPPTSDELSAIRRDVREAISTLPEALSTLRGRGEELTLVGVAGTVTSLAAIAGEVDPYDASRVHGALLPRATLASLTERLASMTTAERRTLPGLSPKRADVIVAGAAICQEVAEWLGARGVLVSDRGVRWGLALRLLGGA